MHPRRSINQDFEEEAHTPMKIHYATPRLNIFSNKMNTSCTNLISYYAQGIKKRQYAYQIRVYPLGTFVIDFATTLL
jgi:hypothetical protein